MRDLDEKIVDETIVTGEVGGDEIDEPWKEEKE